MTNILKTARASNTHYNINGSLICLFKIRFKAVNVTFALCFNGGLVKKLIGLENLC